MPFCKAVNTTDFSKIGQLHKKTIEKLYSLQN